MKFTHFTLKFICEFVLTLAHNAVLCFLCCVSMMVLWPTKKNIPISHKLLIQLYCLSHAKGGGGGGGPNSM